MPRRKLSDWKPRGRVSAYAFFLQTSRAEHKKNHPGEEIVFGDFSRMCGQKWQSLSNEEKKPFVMMAEKDKIRYDLEMKSYHQAGGAKKDGQGKKEKKMTKKARDAFFWYSCDERPRIEIKNPYLSASEITNQIQMNWTFLDPKSKQEYETIAQRASGLLPQPGQVTVVDCRPRPQSKQ